jgi:hypothetical protein
VTRRHPRPITELKESVAHPDSRGGGSSPGDRLQSDLVEFIKEADAPVVVTMHPLPFRLAGSIVSTAKCRWMGIDQGSQRFLYRFQC